MPLKKRDFPLGNIDIVSVSTPTGTILPQTTSFLLTPLMTNPFFRNDTLLAGAVAVALLAGCAGHRVRNSPVDVTVSETSADETTVPAVKSRGLKKPKPVATRPVPSDVNPTRHDLASVAGKMARSILAIPEIARAKTTPRVVLEPVVNETLLIINRDVFLTRMRTELNTNAADRVRFLSRDDMRALERELQIKHDGIAPVSVDPNEVEFRGANYFLTGKFQSMPAPAGEVLSETVLYSFQLIDAATSEIVWENTAELKKPGLDEDTAN